MDLLEDPSDALAASDVDPLEVETPSRSRPTDGPRDHFVDAELHAHATQAGRRAHTIEGALVALAELRLDLLLADDRGGPLLGAGEVADQYLGDPVGSLGVGRVGGEDEHGHPSGPISCFPIRRGDPPVLRLGDGGHQQQQGDRQARHRRAVYALGSPGATHPDRSHLLLPAPACYDGDRECPRRVES